MVLSAPVAMILVIELLHADTWNASCSSSCCRGRGGCRVGHGQGARRAPEPRQLGLMTEAERLSAASGVDEAYFGTDGIRGVAGELLTPEFAVQVGRAAAVVLAQKAGPHPLFVIGRDTRLSGPMLEAALTAGLTSGGARVEIAGVSRRRGSPRWSTSAARTPASSSAPRTTPSPTTASSSSRAPASSSATRRRPRSRRTSSTTTCSRSPAPTSAARSSSRAPSRATSGTWSGASRST